MKKSFEDINNEQVVDRTIARSFDQCGVNPFINQEGLNSFCRHLESLSKVKVYELLLEGCQEMPLKIEIDD